MAVRIGVLSAARIAPRALIQPAWESNDVEVVAVAARDVERARQFARVNRIPEVLSSYRDLISSSGIDAVYIATPNALHGQWAAAAIEQGKHVLVEKPFTANAEEARWVASVAKESDVVVMEAVHNLFHPAIARVREILEAGEVGDLRRVETHFTTALGADSQNVRWQAELAGGALMDVGCYPLRLVRYLSAEEPTVTAASVREYAPGVDAEAHVELSWDSGATAQVDVSMWHPGPGRTMGLTVTGDRGVLRATHPFIPHEGNEIVLTTGDGERRERTSPVSSYEFQLQAFADAVLRGRPFPTHPDDSVAAMELIDSVYIAAGLQPRRRNAQ